VDEAFEQRTDAVLQLSLVAGERIEGTVALSNAGAVRRFSGWVELMAAITAARAEAREQRAAV
jgi:hypothetical protein